MTDEQLFQTLTELDDRRQRATLAHDFDTVAEIVGTTLRYVHGSGTDEDRDLYLKRLREGYYQYQAMEPLRREFRRFGDVVLVHGDMRIHVIVDGNERDFKGRYLQVWALQEGSWRMVAWETTKLG